jgi:hypothetical protein
MQVYSFTQQNKLQPALLFSQLRLFLLGRIALLNTGLIGGSGKDVGSHHWCVIYLQLVEFVYLCCACKEEKKIGEREKENLKPKKP